MTSIAISPALNPNEYDPISTLEKQWGHRPLGKRMLIFVQLSRECLVPGGVKAVLKKRRGSTSVESSNSESNQDLMEAAIENSIEDDFGQMNVNGAGRDSPFDFLYDDTTSSSNVKGKPSKGGGKKFGLGKLKKSIKSSFDRQVTTMAIQAQKVSSGGSSADIRDLLTIGAYVQDGVSNEFNVCLGMTERAEIPMEDAISSDGLSFQIPVIVPNFLLESNNMQNGTVIHFQLWIRSGAAIFAKNRSLRSYYRVGSTSLPVSALQTKLPGLVKLPMQSQIIESGSMTFTLFKDMKFPDLCGTGWTLADPRTDTAYTPVNGKKMLFNPPLEQNYLFPHLNDPSAAQQGLHMFVGTERSTESTVVLPLAIAYNKLLTKAAAVSALHATKVASQLQFIHDSVSVNDPIKVMQSGHAQCQAEILYFLRYTQTPSAGGGGGQVTVTLSLQRPDSIFENLLASGNVPVYSFGSNMSLPQYPSITVPFYPRVVVRSDPRLLPSLLGQSSNKQFIGTLRVELHEEGVGGAGTDVFSPIGPAAGVGTTPRSLDAMVDIDPYLNTSSAQHGGLIEAPVLDGKTGERVGVLVLRLSATTLEGMVENVTASARNIHRDSSSVNGGLVSLVGMDTLMEGDIACYPHTDLQPSVVQNFIDDLKGSSTDVATRRRRQIATMGEFLTFDYLDPHAALIRTRDSKILDDRLKKYENSLYSKVISEDCDAITPDKRKDARPFRPSSSRMDELVSGIGFNVHVHNLSLLTVVNDETSGTSSITGSKVIQNVTCGAPADHFKGFSVKGKNDEKAFAGGLRRLEANRLLAAQRLRQLQENLIVTVANYFGGVKGGTEGRSSRHIPASNLEIAQVRKACIEAAETLHDLTWYIAVRRGNVFSQALGIAVTSYLSHLSDMEKLKNAALVKTWIKEGFLLTFEGLLSAAGKELGMIEDASVGIAMLRMASVIITPHNLAKDDDDLVYVKDSPYIRWLKVSSSGSGSQTQYEVQIGVDVAYYQQRIPAALKNKTKVRFFPILNQMGVDIRQWGANLTKTRGSEANIAQDELDDDEVGIPDNDVLTALNFEAFRKMNAYAHAVSGSSDSDSLSWEQAHAQQQIQQQIHSSLAPLYECIRSSMGKMEHGIIDEAATATAKLGGGSAIFCKSGKDRTAMQVTFKQSQFVDRLLRNNGDGFGSTEDTEKIVKDATLMRVYGTRLPICEKNVGQSLYAFNSLQARFMPDVLKPPPRALAGFLKGGRVFSKEGGIES